MVSCLQVQYANVSLYIYYHFFTRISNNLSKVRSYDIPISFTHKVLQCKRSAPVRNIGCILFMYKIAYAWFAPTICVDNC